MPGVKAMTFLIFRLRMLPLACSVLVLLVFSATSLGQQTQYDRGTPPQLVAGVSPVGGYASTELGNVNLANGALNISIPAGQVGGRGFSIPISINYSSKVWALEGTTDIQDVGITKSVVSAMYGLAQWDSDLYNRIAPGWTFGGVPALRA
jgi:hypothetical protein